MHLWEMPEFETKISKDSKSILILLQILVQGIESQCWKDFWRDLLGFLPIWQPQLPQLQASQQQEVGQIEKQRPVPNRRQQSVSAINMILNIQHLHDEFNAFYLFSLGYANYNFKCELPILSRKSCRVFYRYQIQVKFLNLQ